MWNVSVNRQLQHFGADRFHMIEKAIVLVLLAVSLLALGNAAIVYKRSSDGGLTWTGRLPTPASWETSKEVPTLHRVIGPDGSIYLADSKNDRIRRVGPDGIITTVAGNGIEGARPEQPDSVTARQLVE